MGKLALIAQLSGRTLLQDGHFQLLEDFDLFLETQGLGQKVMSAHAKSFPPVCLVSRARENGHLQLWKRLPLQPTQDIEPVAARHSQIQQEQMWEGMFAAVSKFSFAPEISHGLAPIHGVTDQSEVL